MRTPVYTNGLQIFVEADELAGANGSLVSSFTDLSGNDRHLTQGSARPVIETDAINGKKAVVWDGSKNALKTEESFQITCGFLVARVNDFTNYNGVLTTLENYGILVGNHLNAPNWFDFGYDRYEIRLNDRIFPDDAAPTPTGEWGIIFFRFWRALQCDGIQLGSDRNFSGRKADMKVALLALYDRGFCEEEIRLMHESIGYSYQLPIEDVFPYRGSKTDTFGYNKKVLSDGQDEPVLRLKRGIRKSPFDLDFSFRSSNEFRDARAFWNSHYPEKSFIYRDYGIIPPEDTVTRIPENTEFESRGTNGVTMNYGFTGVETEDLTLGVIPEAPAEVVAASPDEIVVDADSVIVGADTVTAGGTLILG